MAGLVCVDPEVLKQLALKIYTSGETISNIVADLNSSLQDVANTWKDSYAEGFDRDFRSELESLSNFVLAVEKYTTYLHNKAEALNDYK